MVNLKNRLYRVTVPGNAAVDGVQEHFPLGRVVDAARFDVQSLEFEGVETTKIVPASP